MNSLTSGLYLDGARCFRRIGLLKNPVVVRWEVSKIFILMHTLTGVYFVNIILCGASADIHANRLIIVILTKLY